MTTIDQTYAVDQQGVEPFALLGPGDRSRLPGDVVDAYPLAEIQVATLDLPGQVDVATCVVTDDTPFSPERFAAAADMLLRRYEMLRASIDVAGCSEPVQRAHADAALTPRVYDHRGLDDDARRVAIDALLDAERSMPFDLSVAPMLRLNVVLVADATWLLAVAAPRPLTVVVSLVAVLDELVHAYRGSEPTDSATAVSVAGSRATAVSVAGSRRTVRHAGCVAAELDALSDFEGELYWQSLVERYAPVTLPAAWAGGTADARRTVPFADLEAGLRALAAAADAPLSTVLLAAHLKVLATLTIETAIRSTVIFAGAARSGGAEPTCDELLHRYELPFPVPTGLSTWRDLVDHVHREVQDAWLHRHFRRPESAGDDEPLMHIAFELREAYRAAGGVTAGGPSGPRYGLHVLGDAGQLLLTGAGGAVAPAHAERLAGMYRAVLVAMATDPAGDARAAYLAPGERDAVLGTWAAGPVVARGDATVVDLIQAQAAATPDAVAVRTADGHLTYRELDERSNRLAHHLRELGAVPDGLVGVCLGRTTDLVPALLAVWKAGAGYLPLDPELPPERLRHMVEATACPLVVTSTDRLPVLGDLDRGRVVLVDTDREAIAARPASPVRVRIDPGQVAYAIYTSGSTGVPKGVVVPHAGLANYLLWTVDAYGSRGSGGAPVFSSISFDLGIPDIFTPLITGEATHLLPEPFDTAELGSHLAAGGPYSFIKMTPGHLDLLTYQLTAEQARDLAGIVIAAGDSFTTALAGRWLDLAGPDGTAVATEYGPTEITVGNSGQPIVDLPDMELVPLGAPIPNSTMYVLNDLLQPVPVGVPGEVYIGGVGVTRGYLGRPDLTAQRFLPDPYGTPGTRLYKTGDLARWSPDGALEFLGRMDNQVKIRGYRVELGEIQARLISHPTVRDAVVVARQSPQGDKRLAGYVVLNVGQRLDSGALRAHLAEALPDYMIPAAIVAVGRIPLTTNGKVDSRALPAVV